MTDSGEQHDSFAGEADEEITFTDPELSASQKFVQRAHSVLVFLRSRDPKSLGEVEELKITE